MESYDISKLICDKSLSIVEAMSRIDENAKGMLFVINNEHRLIGSITDGDIRRWILKNGDIQASVDKAMNNSPRFLSVYDKSEAISIMKEGALTAIPIVDSSKNIINIITLNDTATSKKKRMLDNVLVVIMAGGEGTRLYPYTKIIPKPLIPIGEIPIVEKIMDRFVEYGTIDFTISVNYKKGMIRSYFNDVNKNYSITYIEEDKPLGTAGSIKLISKIPEKPMFVVNCDALIIADYNDIYEHHVNLGNVITMVTALKNITIPYGVVHFGDDGKILNLEEKPKLSYFINTGMYIINPSVIELIPDNEKFHMTDLVEKVIQDGGKVGTYPISEDSFLDMGEFSEMKRMEQKLNIISDK